MQSCQRILRCNGASVCLEFETGSSKIYLLKSLIPIDIAQVNVFGYQNFAILDGSDFVDDSVCTVSNPFNSLVSAMI